MATLSIISKEWIYRYTLRVARQIKSKLVEANAWHSRSDAFSSVVVLLGIIGAMAGFEYLDSIAAIIVAAMIVHVGGGLILEGIKELIDTGVGSEEILMLEQTMAAVEGVRDVHHLRTRKMGATVLADVHILVDPDISVSEGHRISVEVETSVSEVFQDPIDVTVHVDPQDDSDAALSYLPMRQELDSLIRKAWSTTSDVPLQNIGIHYLQDKVDIDIELPSEQIRNTADVTKSLRRLRRTLAEQSYIGQIRALVSID